MTSPRLATYSIDGATDTAPSSMAASSISPRTSRSEYPTLREVIAAGALPKLAEEAARASAGSCARCHHLAAADPGAGKDHLHRRELSGPQRRIQGRPGRAEISQHVHAHAALLRRPRDAAGAPARLGAARLRGRTGAGHRQGRPAHPGKRRAGSHRRGHAVQRRHHPRLGAARQVQRHPGQEFRFHRQPRPVARALHR